MTCKYCQTEIPKNSIKCYQCSEYTSGIQCTECQSSIPDKAKICKFCGNRVNHSDCHTNRDPLHLKAKLLPTFLFRFRFLPHEISSDSEKIVITTPGTFRLWENSDEIPWNKVAGFNYRDGIFWDRIEIETRGQMPSSIIGIGKEDGATIRTILQGLEK